MPRPRLYLPWNSAQLWPKQSEDLTPAQVVAMYERGFCGSVYSPEDRAQLLAEIVAAGGGMYAADIAHENGFAGSAAGRLVVPFLAVAALFPNAYPGPAQVRGDCVSHGASGAALITVANEIWNGRPDEVTGELEGVPDLTEAGRKNGVLSSEWFWWYRGYSGDGWNVPAAASVVLAQGMMLRKQYPEIGLDLTEYTGALTRRYGRSKPPAEMQAIGKQHAMRYAAECEGAEDLRDMLAQGFGVQDSGNEGFSRTRDENGVARRSGRWAHSMKVGGFDDRPETHSRYGGPLVLIINNWGVWNGGPRDIADSARHVPESLRDRWAQIDIVNPATGNLMIPPGAFWARWEDVNRRYFVAYSGAAGWKARQETHLVF